MEMTEYDISGLFQRLNYPLPHSYTFRNLAGVGKQTMPPVTQCHTGINNDPSVTCRNQTALAADP